MPLFKKEGHWHMSFCPAAFMPIAGEQLLGFGLLAQYTQKYTGTLALTLVVVPQHLSNSYAAPIHDANSRSSVQPI